MPDFTGKLSEADGKNPAFIQGTADAIRRSKSCHSGRCGSTRTGIETLRLAPEVDACIA
jgi:hypothetical protein